jgi:glutamine amidotransferase-like uncharacterized protein
MKNIIVYQDLMASTQALIHLLNKRYASDNVEIIQANGEGVRQKKYPNKDSIAFFLPGTPGGSSAYREQLQQEGFDYITAQIKSGMHFFGICAGAYLAAEDFSYKFLMTGEHRAVHSPLGIIEGRADGPIIEMVHADRFAEHSGMSAVKIEFNALSGAAEHSVVFYSTGPKLSLNDQHKGEYSVLARFADAADRPIAALRRHDLGGQVTISSFPFEFGDEEYINYIDPNHMLPKSFYSEMDKIRPHQPARERFCDVFLRPIELSL